MGDLIKQLEVATEGSRELDIKIKLHLEPTWMDDTPQLREYAAPHYTTCVTTALTLVPEGWWWRLALVPFTGIPVHGVAVPPAQAEMGTSPQLTPAVSEYGHTPALAICTASSKARNDSPHIQGT